MNKIKNILFIMLLSLIMFSFNDVYAISKVKVGNIDINDEETKEIYGGSVSFSGGVLTLDNVNINEMYKDGADNYHSIYNYGGDISIKLVGTNTIKAIYSGSQITSYFGISSSNISDAIGIIGDGTLNYNVGNFHYNYLVSSEHISLGTSFFEQGPTININLNNKKDLNYNAVFDKLDDVIRTNIVINATNTYNFEALKFNDSSDILASNIYFNNTSTGTTRVINNNNFVQFRNCNMFIKVDFDDSLEPSSELTNVALASYGTSATQTVRFKNAHCYIETPIINSSNTELLLARDEGEIDTYLVGKVNGTLTFSGVYDEYKYSSKTTKEALTEGYETSELADYKYLYFNSFTYLLQDGDNQNIESDSTFTFRVNVSPVLLKTMKVDNTTFTSKDYTYDYNDGTVTFTNSGMNKIKKLGNGEHTIHLNYQSDKSIDVNFTFTNTDPEPNPETFDSIFSYIAMLLVSFVCIVAIVISKKKTNA